MIIITGSFTHKIYADTYQEICEQWANHASTPWKLVDLYNLLINSEDPNIISLAQAIYNYAVSNKTTGFVDQACAIHGGHGGSLPDNSHGGHGGTWDPVGKSADEDLKNGTNRNYYNNDSHNSTSNYNIVNNNNQQTNINYTYNNQTYNYTTNIENNYYNIQNNSYNFYFNQTDYLTYVNTYNNTTIIYQGDTTELYYRLPDGSDSFNLTEEEAYNGYKTSLSVSSYENTYDANDLVFLYHFDDNEYDAAYPTNTVLSFSKNSVNYVNDLNFAHAIAFNGDTVISVNKNSIYSSFRFYPLIDDSFSIYINGTFIGGSERTYQTITHYDEFYNVYFIKTAGYIYPYKVNDNLYILADNSLGNTGTYAVVGSSFENCIRNLNDYQYFNCYVFDDGNMEFTSGTYNYSVSSSRVYNPENLDLSSYLSGSNYSFSCHDSLSGHLQKYIPESYVSNRSYNYINYDYYINSGSFNLVNLNMWNFCSVLLDGSVYINGIDTGIDVDNTQNLTLSFLGDSVFYFDELFGNSVNRSVTAPSRPYDTNIVYYLPDDWVNNCVLIQSLISVSQYKFGGIRPSSPVLGYVYISVNEVGNVTSVQQFNGIEWVSVNGGIYNEYLNMWINVIGFNIFNNNWDVQDLNYQTESDPLNSLIKFLTTQFNRVVNAIKNIRSGDDVTYLENEYDVDIDMDINNFVENLKNADNDINLQSPEFNLPSGDGLSLLSDIPLETIKIFTDNNLGVFIFLPLVIAILGMVL